MNNNENKENSEENTITIVKIMSKWYILAVAGLEIGYSIADSLGLLIGLIIGAGFGLFLQKYHKK